MKFYSFPDNGVEFGNELIFKRKPNHFKDPNCIEVRVIWVINGWQTSVKLGHVAAEAADIESLVSSPDPTPTPVQWRGSGDIQLISWASSTWFLFQLHIATGSQSQSSFVQQAVSRFLTACRAIPVQKLIGVSRKTNYKNSKSFFKFWMWCVVHTGLQCQILIVSPALLMCMTVLIRT